MYTRLTRVNASVVVVTRVGSHGVAICAQTLGLRKLWVNYATAEQRTWIAMIEEQVRQHWLRYYKHGDKLAMVSTFNLVRAIPSAVSDDLRERLRVYKRVKSTCGRT